MKIGQGQEYGISYVAVQVFGGLGNQLFQYAVGRALSLRYNVPLVLDTGRAKTEGPMAFCLNELVSGYALVEPHQIPPPAKTAGSRYKKKKRAARDAILHWLGMMPRRIDERPFNFNPQVFAHKPPVYLSGYWQTEKYFVSCADTIRDDLRLPFRTHAEHARVFDTADVTPVSLHVRRGDYVGNAMHPCCSPHYYRRAAEYIAGRCIQEPVFLVFSDDIAWARKNLDLPYRTLYMNAQGEHKNYEDLAFMKACHAHIIANSSFSWWGAWLNSRSDKIVVAPDQWFGSTKTRELDIVPDSWVVLQ